MYKASPGDRLHHSPSGSCTSGSGRGHNPSDLALPESKAEIQSSDPDRRLQLPGVLSIEDPTDQEMEHPVNNIQWLIHRTLTGVQLCIVPCQHLRTRPFDDSKPLSAPKILKTQSTTHQAGDGPAEAVGRALEWPSSSNPAQTWPHLPQPSKL